MRFAHYPRLAHYLPTIPVLPTIPAVNLQSAIFNLQSSICNLQSAIFNLQSSIFNLQSYIFPYITSSFPSLSTIHIPSTFITGQHGRKLSPSGDTSTCPGPAGTIGGLIAPWSTSSPVSRV